MRRSELQPTVKEKCGKEATLKKRLEGRPTTRPWLLPALKKEKKIDNSWRGKNLEK